MDFVCCFELATQPCAKYNHYFPQSQLYPYNRLIFPLSPGWCAGLEAQGEPVSTQSGYSSTQPWARFLQRFKLIII